MSPSDTQHDSDSAPQDGELANTRLGEFLLLRRLGAGGMAEVYLAEQTSLDRSVAVKVLRADAMSADNAVMLKRFEQEARAAAGLNHTNIVQVFTTGRYENVSYIVQEYVPGLNLSQWIRKHGCPDYVTGLRWMQQIAAALKVAAEAGVVHRDIKPENIMITRSGVAKVTDFGLAQLSQSSPKKMNLTQAGTTMGTPWYMSPEQIQGEKLDHRSDQYSFGITCFHMFTGRPPFPGKNAMVVAMQHLKEDPPPIARQRADLPAQLCETIHRMMARKAADRFASAAELEQVLLKLNHVPVNHRLEIQTGWKGRIRPWLPSPTALITSVIAAAAAGFVASGQMNQPVQINTATAAPAAQKLESAAHQFGYALLHPRSTGAWLAVINEFPKTPEAEIARIHLALTYLNGPLAEYEKTLQQFEELAADGMAPEKSHLQFLGLIGQAMTIHRLQPVNKEELQQNKDKAQRLLDQAENVFSGNDSEQKKQQAMEWAPRELREFYYRGNENGPGPGQGP
jgi:eukaryotic-like serine/threonine-protein kinase